VEAHYISQVLDEADALGLRHPEIHDHQIDAGRLGAHPCEELHAAPHGDGLVSGRLERGPEAVAYERRVVGDDDAFDRHRRGWHSSGVSGSAGSDVRGI
jgi:hypothetical protein